MHKKLIEFWDMVYGYTNNYPYMRTGQIYINSLYHINHDLCNQWTNSPWDCFYNDELCDKFLEQLYIHYGENKE